MYLLRDVQRADLDHLRALARELDTVNLPDDPEALEEVIDRSVRSFTGRIRDPFERMYLFVLEEPSGRLVGTALVIAQHGTRDAPHVYFQVDQREHYSHTLDRHFRHQVLRIGYNFDGPTEIGGLVVDPRRRGEGRPGKQLSFARFLYMAMHPQRFRDTVIAELLPPLLPDGRSLLWEALGRRFTGLSYQEADRLSRTNKEFIQNLFPQGDLYVSLLPARVQRAIGRVGPSSEPVRTMLEKIGFRYAGRIDPFDGGPHFHAPLRDVSLLRDHRTGRAAEGEPDEADPDCLVGVERPGARVHFRAVRARCRFEGDRIVLGAAARRALALEAGERAHVIPFP